MKTQTVLLITTVDKKSTAKKIAQALIASKKVACVQIHSPCQSLYHWQNKIQASNEIPLHIKTTKNNLAAINRIITKLHPYQLPEIISIDITAGLTPYLNWIKQESNRK